MGQGDFYNAQLCLEKALELDPENATYKENLLKCKAKLTQSSAVDGSPFATFDQLFTNPNFINMAQSVIQNPEFQQVFTNLADGAASNEGGTFDFSTIMNTFQTAVENLQNDDPETLENLRNAFSPNQPQ
ncbi:hypothetical protein HZS_6369 [Henneguya salminicola]|uniref:Small glutamine-rich tetratricopeptide repeat-containing protein beta (Trinotate prediction) n=1 Tax=Henneguya salminicola TaxID=69463 RepID=A0A6G3MEU4_HENSL|nr:hypothetical protein HZS_6369 [Henneguya salminicola]